MSRRKNSPPRFMLFIIERFFRSDRLEEIYGDLVETFHEDLEKMAAWKAKTRFFFGSLLFFKPSNHRTMNNITFMLLKNYLKVSLRSFKKNRLYSTINTLGLSVGLAVVFIAMYWINYHLSFDRFHSKSESIYEVLTNGYSSSGEIQTNPGANYRFMEEAQMSIPGIGSVTRLIYNWRWPSEQCFKIDEGKDCIYSKGIFADSSFFEVFDFKITNGETNPLREPRSIVLSESIAKQLYGDENPVGRTYRVDNHFEVKITGVFKDVPPTSSLQFAFVAPLDLVYELWGTNAEQMRNSAFYTYLTLNTNDYQEIESAINKLNSKEEDGIEYILQPFTKVHLYGTFENGKASGGLIDYIKIFGLFAAFTLLMSMVNFINLTTAQASIRGKEIGVRKVSGASRSTLQIQFVLEIFLKVTIAAAIALTIVFYTLPVFNEIIDEKIEFSLNTRVTVYVVSIIVATTFLSGVYPALVLSRFNPVQVLKNLQFKGRTKSTTRRWLTTIQIGLSGVIIILTSVIYLQLDYLQTKNIGYDREGIIIMEPTWQHIKNYESFSTELLQYHQIKGIGVSNSNMIDATGVTDNISWPGKLDGDQMLFKQIGLDNGLLRIFDVELMQGSDFSLKNDSVAQVIVTETAVRQMNLDDPIGKRITHNGTERVIVGVAKDFNSESLHKSIIPAILFNVEPKHAGTIYIRYDKNYPEEALEIITNQYGKFEKFFNMKFTYLDQEYQQHYKNEQIVSNLATVVMVLAVLIAGIGVLGLSAFNIVRRYREIGLRKIFGASITQIINLLAGEFVKITLVASLITLPLSFLLMNFWLSNFAYRIEVPYELFVINFVVTVAVVVILVTMQSLKVAHLNPASVVRNE